jgi:predicted ATPase
MIFTYVLTGAHGTGKSTLLNELRSIPGYKFSDSVTRKSGAVLNQEGTDEGQLKILSAILDYEQANQLYQTDYILDRSFIDFYAYTIYLYRRDQVTYETFKRIKSEFKERLKHYTLVFYLPIEFDIEQDGVRSDDTEFQTEIDEIIRTTLTDNEVSFIPVTGTVEQRVSDIKQHIPFISHVDNKQAVLNELGSKGELEEYLDDDSYVMCHNNTIVSVLSYRKSDRLKISYLYTDQAYRGSRLASRLMDKLLADTKGLVVYLYIKEDALPFYRSYGIDKFIMGESIYSGPKPNYFATFLNADTLEAIEPDEAALVRLKC